MAEVEVGYPALPFLPVSAAANPANHPIAAPADAHRRRAGLGR
jgi:hypothetical protein